jgi:predicted lipoprotein
MAYNQSFRLSKEVAKIQKKHDSKKVNPTFRAMSSGSVVTLDFGVGSPQIELTINGDYIDARFTVAPRMS